MSEVIAIPVVGELVGNQALQNTNIDTEQQNSLNGSDVSGVLTEISGKAEKLTDDPVTEAKIVASALTTVNEKTGHDFDVRLFLNGVVASHARAAFRRRHPHLPR